MHCWRPTEVKVSIRTSEERNMTLTAADKLLYSTVKLETYADGVASGTGTAFFYTLRDQENRTCLLLVTNKHVISGADTVVAVCHTADPGSPNMPSGKFTRFNVLLGDGVIGHPDANVDLCAISFTQAQIAASEAGQPLFLTAVNRDAIPNAFEWENFDSIEEVLMIGCPRGIWDEANNLPIARRGITASALNKRYEGKEQFVVDIACFPGSSGSPVYLYDRMGFVDRAANSYQLGKSRQFLLGILFAGPLFTQEGHIAVGNTQRVEVAAMMHLGFVIRSTALLELESRIRAIAVPYPGTQGARIEVN